MELWQKYLRPATIDEALSTLEQHGGEARVVAGHRFVVRDAAGA
jgi:CO/xanthine dehydrogenase FAD-binding subunit